MARTTNSSVADRLTRRDRMSTSGLSTSVTPPRVVVGLDERLGVGAGQAGPDRPGAEHDDRAGDGDGRQRDRQRAAGVAERRCAAAWAKRTRSSGGGEEPGGDEGQRERRPGAGRRRARRRTRTARRRARAPRPGRGRGRRTCRPSSTTNAVPISGQQRPPADVLDGRHGLLELVADQPEVGPHRVPRLARREERRRTSSGRPARRPPRPARPRCASDGQHGGHAQAAQQRTTARGRR